MPPALVNMPLHVYVVNKFSFINITSIIIIIITIERKDFGGVTSKDCKDTLHN